MAAVGLDFYSHNPPRDVTYEVTVGAAAGTLGGGLFGLLLVLFWQSIVPLGGQLVDLWLALGVSTFVGVLCGISGGILALARTRADQP